MKAEYGAEPFDYGNSLSIDNLFAPFAVNTSLYFRGLCERFGSARRQLSYRTGSYVLSSMSTPVCSIVLSRIALIAQEAVMKTASFFLARVLCMARSALKSRCVHDLYPRWRACR